MSQISVLKLSQIDKNNLSAEFYHPAKLAALKKLQKFKNKVSDKFVPAKKIINSVDDEKTVNLDNIHNGFIDDYSFEESKSSKKILKENDVVISKLRPYLKEIAFVTGDFGGAHCSTELIILREKIKEGISKFGLFPFLFTKEVQTILFWSQKGTNHPRFDEDVLLDLGTPDFSNGTLKKLKSMILESCVNYAQSKQKYKEAENLIIKNIGFNRKSLDNRLKFIINFLDMKTNDRFDASFYRPEYSDLIKFISTKGYVSIEDVKQFNKRGAQPQYSFEGEIKVVTSKHLGSDFVDFDNLEKTTVEDYENQKRSRVKKFDVLIYTTGAYVGRTNCFFEDGKILASNHVNILRVKGINPVYLAVFLNSQLGQMQVQKYVSGSAQAELYPKHIEKFVVWDAPKELQNKVAEKATDAYILRKKALELLERAKNEVESLMAK